nr:putative cell wall protein [Ipomoea batatas]GMC72830.1 putative cell wall protein [Ipomoea batatas]GMD80291.1 putative cell wall protein [Ipomoea batatas]GME02618.1 putative cell wall protein [Ipomoea batatas]
MAAITLRFICAFLSILVLSSSAFAGRGMPNADSKNMDKKQPEFLYDGTVLIPGFGRVVIPHKKVDPFNYNPVTGRSGSGTGAINPIDDIIGSGSAAAGSTYIPGNDDTIIPNPGFEVPAVGGGLPTPPARH